MSIASVLLRFVLVFVVFGHWDLGGGTTLEGWATTALKQVSDINTCTHITMSDFLVVPAIDELPPEPQRSEAPLESSEFAARAPHRPDARPEVFFDTSATTLNAFEVRVRVLDASGLLGCAPGSTAEVYVQVWDQFDTLLLQTDSVREVENAEWNSEQVVRQEGSMCVHSMRWCRYGCMCARIKQIDFIESAWIWMNLW